ncbi:MAG: hypothetical protein ACREK8_04875, partial [Gemmatimonadales bacterium]
MPALGRPLDEMLGSKARLRLLRLLLVKRTAFYDEDAAGLESGAFETDRQVRADRRALARAAA